MDIEVCGGLCNSIITKAFHSSNRRHLDKFGRGTHQSQFSCGRCASGFTGKNIMRDNLGTNSFPLRGVLAEGRGKTKEEK